MVFVENEKNKMVSRQLPRIIVTSNTLVFFLSSFGVREDIRLNENAIKFGKIRKKLARNCDQG